LKNNPKPSSLRVRIYPDPVLTEVCETVEDVNEEVLAYIERMKIVLKSMSNGIGLAASQVGLLLRIYVAYDKLEPGNAGELVAYINPSFKPDENNKAEYESEGCLSFPGISGDVERPTKGVLTYTNESGKKVEEHVESLKARCAQHEIDHLMGISLPQSMTEASLKKSKQMLNRLSKRRR